MGRICGGKERWNGKKGTLAELKEKYPDVWNHWVVIGGRTPEYLSVWISMQSPTRALDFEHIF